MKRTVAILPFLLLVACMTRQPQAGDSLDGTRWRVVAVDGQKAPPSGDYSIRFDAPRLGASFGCNGIGGHYARAGDTLTVREIVQTLMGCPEPAMTFERKGAAILQQPMAIGRHPTTGGMVLSNARGRIDLALIVPGRRI